MYHQHFGLSGPPFQFTPTPGALYLSKTHREGLAALEWGLLHEPTGFTLLVGESGIGKSTLACSILARSYANVRTAYVTSPKLNFDQMMQVIMSQFFRATRGQTKLELIESFSQLLEDLAPGERLAIVIDEAQEMAEETLEEFRLLSNLDTAPERRLQLILVGQPELMEHLASPRMLSLNQRVGARMLLKALQPAEAREYIDCRLRAKGRTAKKIFAAAALNHLVAHSHGIPRRINVLCHNSMLAAFASGSRKVSLTMARNAVSEYENLLGKKRPLRDNTVQATHPLRGFTRAALAVAALTVVALVVLYVWSSQAWFESNTSHAAAGGRASRPSADFGAPGPKALPGSVAPASSQPPTGGVTYVSDAESPNAADLAMNGTQAHAGERPENSRIAVAGNQQRDIRVDRGHSETLAKTALRYWEMPAALGWLPEANLRLRNIDRIYQGELFHLPPSLGAVVH